MILLVFSGIGAGAVLTGPAILCAQPAPPAEYVPLDMADLEQLAAPVALYPDAVLAQVMAASSYPLDVVRAAQWLDAGNDPAGIDSQDWDPSVKGVARFPQVLHYMAGNVDWMNNLGDAFLNQQADLMNAVQILRGQAYAAGNLVTNSDQQVIPDGDNFEIIPADPDVIYVPVYDPAVIYLDGRRRIGERWSPPINYGPGIRVGPWLRDDFDWHDRRVYEGDWGASRPWWHHDARDVHYFDNVRPGTYRSSDPKGAAASHVWQRDAHKPAPVAKERAAPRPPDQRPGTGYPPKGQDGQRAQAPVRAPASPVETSGPVVIRQSQRGQESRERAAPPAPAARPPEPARTEPQAPRAAARPEPAARPSEPTGGGAMGGYQNGAEASQSSSRGAASRGAAATGGRR